MSESMARVAYPVPLDPFTLPLQGSALIEASAGTGKTFTIALLYLRWILGHGGSGAPVVPRMPPELLVVTFTEAATRELRGRIRERLSEAAHCFMAGSETTGRDSDDPLIRLRADYAPAQWPALAQRLNQAAQWMDEAAISTIHGWAFRMLREHAFDSGSLFSLTLLADTTEILAECTRDYWRTFVYALPEEMLCSQGSAGDVYLEHFPDPDALMKAVSARLAYPVDASLPDPGRLITQAITALETDRQKRRRELAATLPVFWTAWNRAVASKGLIKGLKKPSIEDYLYSLQLWCDGDEFLNKQSAIASRLRREGADSLFLSPADFSELEGFWTAFESALDGADAPEDLSGQLVCHAAGWISRRLAEAKQKRAEMGFDDLLKALDDALGGPGGERLAHRIREQYPVAMIDEFQDTDPVQYRLFDRIYRISENDPETTLLMIGDPKQAIYSFRGADIFAYLAARRATSGRHYTLGTNFRSTVDMVAAINHVFSTAEVRPGGAFRFQEADVNHTAENELPFFSVGARGRSECFVRSGRVPAPVTVWQVPTPEGAKKVSKKHYQEAMALACAHEIVSLLNAGDAGEAGFLSSQGEFKPVHSGDIAVLVNSGYEADLIRQGLRQVGVKSVYLSDRNSVLDTQAARDVLVLLRACAEPMRESAVRSALATPLLQVEYTRLDQLNNDELAWESMVERFLDYHARWRSQGVLAMLYRLLHDFEVPARLLQKVGGERELTDILHLAELLQTDSQHLDGELALVRSLSERIQGNDSANDALQVRLESDAGLVQVVTVHKSKGLEYPLVFLPFATFARKVQVGGKVGGAVGLPHPVVWHENGRIRVAYEAEPEQVARADEERLGEDLRKLYVALTRARHGLWMGVAALEELPVSALGSLLGLSDDTLRVPLPQALDTALEQWERATTSGGEPLLRREGPPEVLPPARLPEVSESPHPVRRPQRSAAENWWIASYSSLHIRERGDLLPAPDSGRSHHWLEEGDDSITQPQDAIVNPIAEPLRTRHTFYRGPGPGTFLHDVLEWMAGQGFKSLISAPERLTLELERRTLHRRGWSDWVPILADWMRQVVQLPLPLPQGHAVSLSSLTRLQAELEFMFASHDVETQVLDRLITRHTLSAQARPPLGRQTLRGMLKGFIDLVFVSQGRYYVLDYKSNQLGGCDADYHQASLINAVLEKRYDVQYCLYLLALHRLLKSRLPDYDYDTHIGGAVYLFLRGIEGDARGVVAEKPPAALIRALDALFRGESREGQNESA